MKMFNHFFLLAMTAFVLSACGKNNRVGNAGNNILPHGQGIFTSGMSTGHTGLDNIISRIRCNTAGGTNRVYMSFTCAGGACSMGQVSSYSPLANSSLKLGVTPTGDIAIAHHPNPQSIQITFLMCQDGLFNPDTIAQTQITALQILNQNVTYNGVYGQFIANVLFRVVAPQYGYVQINAPFSAIPPQYLQ